MTDRLGVDDPQIPSETTRRNVLPAPAGGVDDPQIPSETTLSVR